MVNTCLNVDRFIVFIWVVPITRHRHKTRPDPNYLHYSDYIRLLELIQKEEELELLLKIVYNNPPTRSTATKKKKIVVDRI